jgi:hypothetical protein
VIAEDDVCYRKFTELNESVVFCQFDALFSEARTICEVDATNSGELERKYPAFSIFSPY